MFEQIRKLLSGNCFVTEVADTSEMYIIKGSNVTPVSEDLLLDVLTSKHMGLGDIKTFTNGVYVYRLAPEGRMLGGEEPV